MAAGPDYTGVPFEYLEDALPDREHRHPRAAMADLLLSTCFTCERQRREAEQNGDDLRAARLEGQIEAQRKMLKVLFFSTDTFEVTSLGKGILAYLDRHLGSR